MDVPHLDRLRHILGLLASRRIDTSHARPACYSGIGFTPALQAAAERGEVSSWVWGACTAGRRRFVEQRPAPRLDTARPAARPMLERMPALP